MYVEEERNIYCGQNIKNGFGCRFFNKYYSANLEIPNFLIGAYKLITHIHKSILFFVMLGITCQSHSGCSVTWAGHFISPLKDFWHNKSHGSGDRYCTTQCPSTLYGSHNFWVTTSVVNISYVLQCG